MTPNPFSPYGYRNAVARKETQPKQATKFDFSWVSVFTLIITVFTAVLFGAGKAYRQAYLQVFGFNDSVLPWPTQDLIYIGAVKQLDIILAAPPIALLATVAITIGIGALLWLINILASQRKSKISSRRNSKKQNFTEAIGLLDLLQLAVNFLGVICIVVLTSTFFAAQAEYRGKTDAESALKSVSITNGVTPGKPELRYVVIKREVGKQRISEEGYLVSCSEKACGIHSPKKNEPNQIIPLDNLTLFTYKK